MDKIYTVLKCSPNIFSKLKTLIEYKWVFSLASALKNLLVCPTTDKSPKYSPSPRVFNTFLSSFISTTPSLIIYIQSDTSSLENITEPGKCVSLYKSLTIFALLSPGRI